MWMVAAFGWGLRHGVDWDHIAAIADLTAAERNRRRAVRLATIYALGHAVVLLVLGGAAVVLGSFVSVSLDGVFGRFAGATLVVLGILVLVHMARAGAASPVSSRTMVVKVAQSWLATRRSARDHLVVEHDHEHDAHGPHAHDPLALLTERERVEVGRRSPTREVLVVAGQHRHPHSHRVPLPPDPGTAVGPATAASVGLLHGVGAATPTQIVLLASAAGATSTLAGVGYLLAFVAGLFATNTAIAVAGALGSGLVGRSSRLYVVANVVTATVSIAIGVVLLAGEAVAFPI
jgi:high-affinity nickel-transport protein